MSTNINNQAAVIYTYSGSVEEHNMNSNNAPIELLNSLNITVSKSASPTTFLAGDIISYSVVITNTGPNYLTGVRIIDDLGGGNLAYVLGSAKLSTLGSTYNVTPSTTNPLNFALQQLNVGQSMTLTYNCQVIFNLPLIVTSITNVVHGIGYTNTSTFSAYSNCTIQKKNQLIFDVVKTASQPSVHENQVFHYTISIFNNDSVLVNVSSISDNLPINFVVLSVMLKIGSGPLTMLQSTDYTLDGANHLSVPSLTGPAITVPANDKTLLFIVGYFLPIV